MKRRRRHAVWWVPALLVTHCACNAILGIGDPTFVTVVADASSDSADAPVVTTDAAVDGPDIETSVCAHGAPFDPPQLVRGLEGVPVFGARLNGTESNIYLSVLGDGGTDLFLAGRESITDSFGPLGILSVSTMSDEYWPTVSADELLMFFESGANPDGPSLSRIWFTSRDTTNEVFRKATLSTFFSTLPEGSVDACPYLVPSGNNLYFSSIGRPDNAATPPVTKAPSLDLWTIQTNDTGTMIFNRRLTEISTDQTAELFPVVTRDQREIFFTRTPADDANDDIWVAQRDTDTVTSLFNGPVKVDDDAGVVNSLDGLEWASWISPDNCRLYFIRTPRDKSAFEARLWVAERRKVH